MSKDAIPKQGSYYEYSVVYTDRVSNLMAPHFAEAMRDLSADLKLVYNAKDGAVALIPGSGTYAMEAVARQFATDEEVLVIRNGYFSFRWSDIFEVCQLPKNATVLCAAPAKGQSGPKAQLAPPPLETVLETIAAKKPKAVFVPHVETSTGIIVPDAYITAVAAAVHKVGGVLVVDGIAAGNMWLDLEATGTDAYITAPQKGWTGPCCVGIVVLTAAGERAARAAKPKHLSFSCNLVQWLDVMAAYENKDGKGPGFKYYTTLPTDSLIVFRDVIKETQKFGFDKSKACMEELGGRVRKELADRGFVSVAADGFAAPGVVVVYSDVAGMIGHFKQQGLQLAGGVPWKLGEGEYDPPIDPSASTFRVGLFGLDKLQNVDLCVSRFCEALDAIIGAQS